MDKNYNPKEAEQKIYELWERSGYFNPDNLAIDANAKPFTILLPPPNITGSLHLGHALNATISDILIRYHRLKGYRTTWLPGIDHAGIATQNVVEKQLRKEGVSRFDLGRQKFIEKVWEWKQKYGTIILDQFRKIGASCDWSRTRFTLDDDYSRTVKEAFVHYYEQGLIYRGERVINWCPHCQTSLSDLEVEYTEEKTKLWHIKYPLEKGGYVVVATTRPETMLGDEAVAVHPDDRRYKKLVGEKVILPIQNRPIPIIADKAIDSAFGTGAVKVTPAHDLLDAEIAERHNLPFRQVINERARMSEQAGALCAGLKTTECRERVVEELRKLNLLEKEEDYTHNVARCYRCASVLEPILSPQWFLKMASLAEQAAKAVTSKQVAITPANFEKPYLAWLGNIKDWCISRQIWWGHQIPAWHCACAKGEQTIFVGLEQPTIKCAKCNKDFMQFEDVLDTWFSSALWPFAGLSEKDVAHFYPSNVLITARDIINLWVGRMIFSGIEFKGSAPFADVLIHGTILTREGKRMSKSLGTGVDPLLMIEKYSADALRFGLIWQAMGNQDIRWDETAVTAGKKFSNKMWNAARFILLQNPPAANFDIHNWRNQKLKLTSADQLILEQLETAKKAAAQHIADFEFGQALHALYDFFWHAFCDVYLEQIKKEKTEDSLRVLYALLLESLKLIHPFMPFVTETIYQELPHKEKQLLMIEALA